MKFKFTFQEKDYVVSIVFGDPITVCTLEYGKTNMPVAKGEAKKYRKDSPNWIVARRTAFEHMLKDAENWTDFSPELRRIAWLHFVDVVKGKL